MIFDGKHVLITGGTGSLGQRLVQRLLVGDAGIPERIVIFSRDEAKQYQMLLAYLHKQAATEDIMYRNFEQMLRFRVGDIRDFSSVVQAVRNTDIVIHAAALKQVPSCEYFPYQAIQTNVMGAHNLVRAIREGHTQVEAVIGVSTDKACEPINVMGMTKALMERIFIEANIDCPGTRFACVRYGNIIGSRGSVVPVFLHQIATGGPLTITLPEMTRFLLSLDSAIDTIIAAVAYARPGETYVPRIPAARVVDLAQVLIGDRAIDIEYVGIRPGEKIHETLVSEEECFHTVERGQYYVTQPMLPEIQSSPIPKCTLGAAYRSSDVTINQDDLSELLKPYLRNESAEIIP